MGILKNKECSVGVYMEFSVSAGPVIPIRGALLHDSFSQKAVFSATAIALKYQATTLTYGELDALTNRVARYLRNLGVGSSQFFAVTF